MTLKIIMCAFGFFALCAIAYGWFILERKINYSLSYKAMVEQTVKDMVKPSALKEGQ